jgi:thiosulfate sulfurtransferase
MSDFTRISIEQAQNLINKGDVSIVDVRDSVSFNNGHIEGAVLLDNRSVDNFIADTHTKTAVIIYCYHGNSSQNAARFLTEQGFVEVYSMDGGFELWRSSGAAYI